MASRDRRELSRGGSRRINKPAQFLTTRFEDLSIIGEDSASAVVVNSRQKRRPKTDEELMDKKLWIAEARNYGVEWLNELPDELRSDAPFMKQLVRQVSWAAVKHASLELSTDEEFVLAARLPVLANEAGGGASIMRTTSSLRNHNNLEISLSVACPYRIDEATTRRYCGGSRAEGGSFDEAIFDRIKDEDGCITRVQLMDPNPKRAISAQEKMELLEKVADPHSGSGWLSLADPEALADPEWLRAAQHRLADVYHELPEGSPEQLAEAYEGYGALNACLASGGAVLVHAQWLVDYAASRPGHSLPKRQDLPAMAVYDGPLFELTTVLVVSYSWAQVEEPDKGGEQLKEVAKLCRWFLKKNRQKRTLIFWDWTALPQHDAKYSPGRISANYFMTSTSKSVDVEFFGHEHTTPMPFAHIRQAHDWHATGDGIMTHIKPGMSVNARIPRSASEQEIYAEGRNNIHLWFSNINTIKLLLTFRPSSRRENDSGSDEEEAVDNHDSVSRTIVEYGSRGWPCFERILSRSISDDLHILDLGRLQTVDLDGVADMNALCAAQADGPLERTLPLNPDEFVALIRTKTFFGGVPLFEDDLAEVESTELVEDLPDKAFLEWTYAQWYEEVIVPSTALEFVALAPSISSSREWDRFFANVLPDCGQLVHLDLHNNPACAIDIGQFASPSLSHALKNMQELYLSSTKVIGDIVALANLSELRTIDLSNTCVSGDCAGFTHLAKLQHILLQSCKSLTGNIESLKRLSPTLEILDLDGCDKLSGNLSRLRRDLPSCTIYYTGLYMHWWKEAESREAELKAAIVPKSRYGARVSSRGETRAQSRARTPNLAAFLTGVHSDHFPDGMESSKASSRGGEQPPGGGRSRSTAGKRSGTASQQMRSGINPDGSTEKFVDIFEAALRDMEEAATKAGEDAGTATSTSTIPSLNILPVPEPSPARLPKKAPATSTIEDRKVVRCLGCGSDMSMNDAYCRNCGKERPPDVHFSSPAKAVPRAKMRIRSNDAGSPLAILSAASRKHEQSITSPEESTISRSGASLPAVNYLSKAAVRYDDNNPANPNLKHTREAVFERSRKKQSCARKPPRQKARFSKQSLQTLQPGAARSSPVRGVTPGSNLIASAVFLATRAQDESMKDDDLHGFGKPDEDLTPLRSADFAADRGAPAYVPDSAKATPPKTGSKEIKAAREKWERENRPVESETADTGLASAAAASEAAATAAVIGAS